MTEERHTRPGSEEPLAILARQTSGLRRTVPLDTIGAALFSVCDGTLTARLAISAIATLLDLARGRRDRAALPAVRALVVDGLVVA